MKIHLTNQLERRPTTIYVSYVCICVLIYFFTDHIIRYFVLFTPLLLLLCIFKIQQITNKLLWLLAFSLQFAVISSDLKSNYYGIIEINLASIPELFFSSLSHTIMILVMLREGVKEKATRVQLFYRFLPFEIVSSMVYILVFIPYLPFSYFVPSIIAFVTMLTVKYFALRRITNKESYTLVVISMISLLLINYMWFTTQFIVRSPIVFLILHISNYFTIYCFSMGINRGKPQTQLGRSLKLDY